MQIKERIIEKFCKLEEGKDWFLNLYMPIMSFSLTELVDEIQK